MLSEYTWKGILVGLILLGGLGCGGGTEYPPGVLVGDDPVQERMTKANVFLVDEYMIRPLARFHIKARVLATERYWLDGGSDLSPVDFALGWGPMSDQVVLDQLDISQSGRFYFWRADQYPIPRKEIIRHSSNMHMIPANEVIKEELLEVEEGDLIEIEGYLVVATSQDGFHWKSSLTRKDTGNGACEIVWVEKLSSL